MPRYRRHRQQPGDIAAFALVAAIFGVLYLGDTVVEFAREYWILIVIALPAALYGIYRFWRWWRQQRLRRLRTLGDFLMLSPSGFEDAVAGVLRTQGYRNVRRVGGSGDLAADIVAVAPDNTSTVVQCKRYAPGQLVGSRDIQTFLGMTVLHHRARGVFVTTSGFTGPALDLARTQGIVLIDGDALVRMTLSAIAAATPSSSSERAASGLAVGMHVEEDADSRAEIDPDR